MCVCFLIIVICRHFGAYIFCKFLQPHVTEKHSSEWLVIYFYFLQSLHTGLNSFTFLPKLLQIAFICISFFQSHLEALLFKRTEAY